MAVPLLGAGINRAYIYTRDGVTELMEAPIKTVEWNRNLCAVSRATIQIEPARCTRALADVHPWAHSLVVFRDEDRVWEGPIRRRRDSRDALTIEASDVIGWTERRPVTAGRNVLGGLVRDQMAWAVAQAFAADNPNVSAYVQALGAATRTADLTVTAAEKYLASVLSDMTANGGRWTALGRAILLWDEAAIIGRLLDLSPENHLLTDVDVIEDGDLLATQVRARNDNGVVGTASPAGVTPVDPYYGLVGQVVSSGATNPTGVTRTASSAAGKAYPTPLTIEVPADAALRCDAPFPITRLVPGVIVPVTTTTATARQVTGTFVLTSVKVTQTTEADERVSITLAPPSEVTA